MFVLLEQLDSTKAPAAELQDRKLLIANVDDTCNVLTEEAQQVTSPLSGSSVMQQTQEGGGGETREGGDGELYPALCVESTLEKKEEMMAVKVRM